MAGTSAPMLLPATEPPLDEVESSLPAIATVWSCAQASAWPPSVPAIETTCTTGAAEARTTLPETEPASPWVVVVPPAPENVSTAAFEPARPGADAATPKTSATPPHATGTTLPDSEPLVPSVSWLPPATWFTTPSCSANALPPTVPAMPAGLTRGWVTAPSTQLPDSEPPLPLVTESPPATKLAS